MISLSSQYLAEQMKYFHFIETITVGQHLFITINRLYPLFFFLYSKCVLSVSIIVIIIIIILNILLFYLFIFHTKY